MTTPQVGLHSLPTELKQQIVRCCADQDALLDRFIKQLLLDADTESLHAAPMRLDEVRHVAAQNRSLAALAAVSPRWNELVATVLFESLPLNKAHSDQFCKRILPRRGRHFVRLTGSWDRDEGRYITDSHIDYLVEALPQLPNLTQLHVPDMVRVMRDRRRHHRMRQADLDPIDEEYRNYVRRFKGQGEVKKEEQLGEQEEALIGLLGRAKSIMHPNMTPEDLVASFAKHHIDGANLQHLEFTSRSARSQRSDLAKVLQHFPNLESLTVHLKLFNFDGRLNRILTADPVFSAGRISLPRLRKLTLMGFYAGDEYPKVKPSSAPLVRLAQPFAETVQVLVLDVRRGDANHKWNERAIEDNVAAAAAVGSPLAFTTTSFPLLRQLTLQGLASAFEHLLPSIDSRKLPALESCLCDFAPAQQDGSGGDHDKAVLDLADASSRIPGFELARVPANSESMTHHLVGYVRSRKSEEEGTEDWYDNVESTWPKPLLRPPPRAEDPTKLRERLGPTVEHLNEWYRSACEAGDSDALAQIEEALEAVAARRTVIDAWAKV